MYIWYDKDIKAYFNLGIILIALGNWDRLEGIIFFAGAGILVIVHCRKSRKYKPLLLFSAVCLLPIVAWQLYMDYVLEVTFKRSISFTPFWDPERMKSLLNEVGKVTFSTFYYGIVIFFGLVMIVANLILSIVLKQKRHWILIACIIIAWTGYVLLFYQMKSEFIKNALISASYKRGLYSYLPPLIFGVSLLLISQYAFGHRNVFSAKQKKIA
jgi:hypothetical protein